MKKNVCLLVSVVIFVLLFYQQNIGLNLSVFTLAIWVFLCYNANHKKGFHFFVLSAATFISVVSFAWYGDFISFASLIISIFLTVFHVYYPQLNLLLSPAGITFNYLFSIVRISKLNQWLMAAMPSAVRVKTIIHYFVIPMLISGVFIMMYSLASARFASYFTFNWGVDIFQIALLTVVGFFLMFGFFHFYVPPILMQCNPYMSDDFNPDFIKKSSNNTSTFAVASQRRSGEISMILLNLILIFFIITYSIEIFGSPVVSVTLSEEVHERVYVLIFSIAMAVLVMMIYFRGVLNFDGYANKLKLLSLIWMGLNLLLIFIVWFQNMKYIHAYGLTFKRIGVFIFLLLSIGALILTYYKMKYKKTNIYLINRIAWMLYLTLIINCGINWSWIVTQYNTTHFNKPDWAYLYSLSYNKQLLYERNRSNGKSNTDIQETIIMEKKKPLLSKKLYYFFWF